MRADRTAIDPTATVASEADQHHHDAGVPCGRLKSDHAHSRTVSLPDPALRPARLAMAIVLMGKRGVGQGGNRFRDVLLPVTSRLRPTKLFFDDVLPQKRLFYTQNAREIGLYAISQCHLRRDV